MSRPSSSSSLSPTLIPGVPNDVAGLILSLIPHCEQHRCKSTCKSWYSFLSSKTLLSLRLNNQKRLSDLLCIFPEDPSISSPYLFDPESLSWRILPLMPCNPHAYGLCNFTALGMGRFLYVLGGSLFDTRSYPLDRPMPCSSAFRFDFFSSTWERLAPMLYPRGSFACVGVPECEQIIAAGGGSRHWVFCAAGNRMSSVERYDVQRDGWVALDGLPSYRAGCVGFLAGAKEDREFWVMGGYGESRTLSGIFPVDEYYRDAMVMQLNNHQWRELGDMWEEGQRASLGKIALVEDQDSRSTFPHVFMLENHHILRYDKASNSWKEECCLPHAAPFNSFAALNGELHVMSIRLSKVFIQIYHPINRTWRYLFTKPPFSHQLYLHTMVTCTVRL